MLWLEARVIGDCFLTVGRASTRNRIRQWLVHRKPTQSAGLPLAKILSDGFRLNGFSEKHPWFVSAFGRHANFWKFTLRVLWPVASTETEVKPHDCRPHFVARLDHCVLNKVLKNWMTRHANVRTRHKRRPECLAPFMEETPKFQL